MKQLYVAMVGLPARGKSTLARRIMSGLIAQGIRAAIFNNGDLRREQLARESASPEFFNPANETALEQRKGLALQNMDRARNWLERSGEVAIIDATHSSEEQRFTILEYLHDRPVLFIECVNEDQLLLDASIRRKHRLPEFAHLTADEALETFKQRIQYYASAYRPLRREPCWLRVDAADCRILAEAPCNDLPYYAAIRDMISTRWVNNLFLARHGETEYNVEGRLGGNPLLTAAGKRQAHLLADHFSNIPVSYIFTSTRLRSAQTAAPILEACPGATTMSLAEFDEIDAGVCEDMRYEDVRTSMPLEYAARSANKYQYVYPRGESYSMLKERVARGLRRALFIAGEDSLLIVGHQAINRTVLSLFLFQRPDDVPYTYIPQNQYYHITVTQRRKQFELIRYA